ncbi:hypothetical protein ACO0E1_02645 [Curtobacterium sp. RRHDQ66]|uniref:hypothetical protein n=1 Tax=Curtobacterium guangdongense TaxID=3413380 RepID=UPI003BEF834A
MMVMVGGCSQDSEPRSVQSPEQRIAAVKEATQRVELELVGLIPAEKVVSVKQEELGSLLSCSDDADQWAGHSRLRLTPGVDSTALTDSLETAAKQKGFEVDRDAAVDGFPRLKVHTKSGISLLIGADGDGTEMRVSSFSACFSVPTDFVPDPSY